MVFKVLVLMIDEGRGIGGNGVIPTAAVRVAVKVTASAATVAALLMKTMTHRRERGRDTKVGGVIRIGDAMILREDLPMDLQQEARMADIEETRSGAQRGTLKMTQRHRPAQARYPSMK